MSRVVAFAWSIIADGNDQNESRETHHGTFLHRVVGLDIHKELTGALVVDFERYHNPGTVMHIRNHKWRLLDASRFARRSQRDTRVYQVGLNQFCDERAISTNANGPQTDCM